MAHATLLRLVNRAFPRTFSCQRSDPGRLPVAEGIESSFADVCLALTREGLSDTAVEQLALEETAERFCLSVDLLRSRLLTNAAFTAQAKKP